MYGIINSAAPQLISLVATSVVADVVQLIFVAILRKPNKTSPVGMR